MISQSQLQEFGFSDFDKFPRKLSHHAVSLNLSSALLQGVEPLEIIVKEGLLIPLQKSASSQGMIIQADGTMLYLTHRDMKDPSSALEAQFIKEIPYEVRMEVSHIMRRAIQVDPSLTNIWNKITEAWTLWFPIVSPESGLCCVGEFSEIGQAWNRIGNLLAQLIEQNASQRMDFGLINVKVVLQAEAEFKKGWMGEEFLVDDVTLEHIVQEDRTKYFLQELFPKMQGALRNPIFSSQAVFRVYYGLSRAFLIKLIISSCEQNFSSMSSPGIELTQEAIDGFSPSFEI